MKTNVPSKDNRTYTAGGIQNEIRKVAALVIECGDRDIVNSGREEERGKRP
jgi:folate-dependent tRNA-U54 methylase TrmFO/GidA